MATAMATAASALRRASLRQPLPIPLPLTLPLSSRLPLASLASAPAGCGSSSSSAASPACAFHTFDSHRAVSPRQGGDVEDEACCPRGVSAHDEAGCRHAQELPSHWPTSQRNPGPVAGAGSLRVVAAAALRDDRHPSCASAASPSSPSCASGSSWSSASSSPSSSSSSSCSCSGCRLDAVARSSAAVACCHAGGWRGAGAGGNGEKTWSAQGHLEQQVQEQQQQQQQQRWRWRRFQPQQQSRLIQGVQRHCSNASAHLTFAHASPHLLGLLPATLTTTTTSIASSATTALPSFHACRIASLRTALLPTTASAAATAAPPAVTASLPSSSATTFSSPLRHFATVSGEGEPSFPASSSAGEESGSTPDASTLSTGPSEPEDAESPSPSHAKSAPLPEDIDPLLLQQAAAAVVQAEEPRRRARGAAAAEEDVPFPQRLLVADQSAGVAGSRGSSTSGKSNSSSPSAKVVLPLMDAIQAVKKAAKAKFDETVEVHVKLGVDPKRSDQTVRGSAVLPHGSGKSSRVAVFAEGSLAEEARAAGADVVGGTELIDEIKQSGGKLNFDKCVATPDMMPRLTQVARILGPRGLMPNPKMGTVTANVAQAVAVAKRGKADFRADRGGVVHVGVGKVSFSDEALRDNIVAVASALLAAKPAGLKKTSKFSGYFNSLTLTSTMGQGVRTSVPSLSTAVDAHNRSTASS